MTDRGEPLRAYLGLLERPMAADCVSESPMICTANAARFGRESEDKLATLYLWLRHVDECESRKDKRKNE